MTPPEKMTPVVLSLKDEHTRLDREIAGWREWWAQLCEIGSPHFGEMGDRITQLRDHLSSHFHHEENEADLPLVRQLSKDKVYHVAELKDEHNQLMAELQNIIDRLQGQGPEYKYWGEAKQDLDTFLERLDHHEMAEEEILDELLQD
ncbi:hypothetical protein Pan153_52320 [Gimesia panareensis]|uniref:Hemerythrin-like domain-containing protein n=1 Tax=Gimesia panareensis TaxID=2527978 RepID=A0A518FWD8_9PLAN|nr:hemerythrin domain-containing protein [Gimesia panareensis]QDV20556.1 hypothetical protein Pan153_52320 [Gimesia panareensis]